MKISEIEKEIDLRVKRVFPTGVGYAPYTGRAVYQWEDLVSKNQKVTYNEDIELKIEKEKIDVIADSVIAEILPVVTRTLLPTEGVLWSFEVETDSKLQLFISNIINFAPSAEPQERNDQN